MDPHRSTSTFERQMQDAIMQDVEVDTVAVVIESSDEEELEPRNDSRMAVIESGIAGGSPAEHAIIPTNADMTDVSQEGDGSIRALIERAKSLLESAEQSSSFSFSPSNPLLERYDVSTSVSTADFFKDSAFSQLCEIASRLRTRLCVERILNLGPPQNPSEQEIFDELLIRYSDEVLLQENNAASLTVNSVHPSDASTPQPSSPGADQDDSIVAIPGPQIHINSSIARSSNPSSPITNTIPDTLIHEFVTVLRKLNTVLTDNTHSQSLSEAHGDDATLKTIHQLAKQLKDSPHFSVLLSTYSTPSKTRKRLHSDGTDSNEETTKKAKLTKNSELDDDEEACSICFEAWTTGGEHRVTSLKCGHLFGLSCITKWVSQSFSCPQCKAPAKKSETRNIFARHLTAEDTSQRDRALRLLEEEQAAKRSLEHKEAVARRDLDTQVAANATLMVKVATLEAQLASCIRSGENVGAVILPSETATQSRPKAVSLVSTYGRQLVLNSRVSIATEGSCRVFEYSKELGMGLVSVKSSNPLFRGFGIKVLSRDFRVLSYQPLHTAPIRDMSFQPGSFDGALLSCGLDKTIQLTCVTSQCVMQKFYLDRSAWCLAWDTEDPNIFYAGMERGVVKAFDLRQTAGPVEDVLNDGGAPIGSLQFWGGRSGNDSHTSIFRGLLIGQPRSLVFKEKRDGQFQTHILDSPQVPLMSLSLHDSGSFLASFRPGPSSVLCQYQVSQLDRFPQSEPTSVSVKSNLVSTWRGSNLQAVLSRNLLFCTEDSRLMAATANHAQNSVSIWDVTRQREHQTVSTFDKTIDLKPVSQARGEMLGALTEKELVLYKWQSD